MDYNEKIKSDVAALFKLDLASEKTSIGISFWITNNLNEKLLHLASEQYRQYSRELMKVMEEKIDAITLSIMQLRSKRDRIETFHLCILILKRIKIDDTFPFNTRINSEDLSYLKELLEPGIDSSDTVIKYLVTESVKVMKLRLETFVETLERFLRIEVETTPSRVKAKDQKHPQRLFLMRSTTEEDKVNRFCIYLFNEIKVIKGDFRQFVKCCKGISINEDVVFDLAINKTNFKRLLNNLCSDFYAIRVVGGRLSQSNLTFLNRHFTIDGKAFEVPKSESRKNLPRELERALNTLR